MEEIGTELPPEVKRKPPKKKIAVKEVTKPLPPTDEAPEEVTLQPGTTSGHFTALDGSKTLIDIMAAIHEGKGNDCCAAMYRRQKMPISVAVNEVAKDSPMLQSWLIHGKAFKIIALVAAMEPLVEHQWRDHLRPAKLARRYEAELAYYQDHPDEAPDGYWDDKDIYVPEPQNQGQGQGAGAPVVEQQPWRGAPAVDPNAGPTEQPEVIDDNAPPTVTKAEYVPGEGVRGGNGAIVPIPQRG